MSNKYAIVEDGIVVNMARSELPLGSNWILCNNTSVRIGDKWDGKTFSPVVVNVGIEVLKTKKNKDINIERERRTFDCFEYKGKPVSCDTLSRSDIDGINGFVALNNTFPDIWPGGWKCADNTYLPITTIDEWKSFYNAMVVAGSALYSRSQELKALLAQATTEEEISAIVW